MRHFKDNFRTLRRIKTICVICVVMISPDNGLGMLNTRMWAGIKITNFCSHMYTGREFEGTWIGYFTPGMHFCVFVLRQGSNTAACQAENTAHTLPGADKAWLVYLQPTDYPMIYAMFSYIKLSWFVYVAFPFCYIIALGGSMENIYSY